MGERADVIGICVPADDHVRAVVNGPQGLLAGVKPGAVIAIHSTILPATALEIAEAARPLGVAVLDACVTGGAARAQQKQITYIVGGDADALEKARPVFESHSVKIIHAGALGNGAKLKLCINLVTYIQWAAAYESFAAREGDRVCRRRCSKRRARRTASSRRSWSTHPAGSRCPRPRASRTPCRS